MRLVASTVLSLTLIFELAKKGGGPFSRCVRSVQASWPAFHKGPHA
jgi:hypothetical protein